ncbi:MAG: TetR/AcrR family transcriptional regulator [FCB group bacterium]|jgi:AcrR family transcriptional regulator
MPKPDVNTETLIYEAAKRVFLKRGMSGARMQEIADEAGINKALLHYYFRTKERLFDEVCKDTLGQLLPELIKLMSSDIDLEEKIYLFFHNHISFLQNNPFLPAFIINELNQNSARIEELLMKDLPFRNFRFYSQLQEKIANGTFIEISPVQFIINLLAWSVFPFVAKPLLKVLMFNFSEQNFEDIIENRKKMLPQMFINSLRKLNT